MGKCLGGPVAALALAGLLAACGSSLPRLRAQLDDVDPTVRIAALKGLVEAKDKVAVPKMIEMLADPEPDVRKESARTLGKVGDTRACQPLADFYSREEIEDVADAGVRALILLGPESEQPLIGILRSIRPTVRAGAARALGKLRSLDAVTPLTAALRDRDERVRIAAVYALREIGDPRGLDAVAGAVRDRDPAVEGAAEDALSGRGYEEGLNRAKRVARRLPYP